MATGYTAAVQDGTVTNFREFALTCARGMGACVMQRDDDMSEKPKLIEASDYYSRSLMEAKNKLKRLSKMSYEELRVKWMAESLVGIRRAKERIQEKKLQEKRYQKMLKEVKNYTPPSPDHVGYKKFMIEQLTESIEHDCGGDYYEEELKKERDLFRVLLRYDKNTFQRRKKELKEGLLRDIKYYTEENEKEQKRTQERNEWITQLYDSLK